MNWTELDWTGTDSQSGPVRMNTKVHLDSTGLWGSPSPVESTGVHSGSPVHIQFSPTEEEKLLHFTRIEPWTCIKIT